MGKRGVAAADARDAEEDAAEFVVLRDLLQFGARISDGDEAIADFSGADLGSDALEEILLEDVGFEGAAGFARDDAERLAEVEYLFDGLDLHGVGGIEDVQFGEPGDFAKGHAQDFGAKAGAAHAKQKNVLEFGGFGLSGGALENIEVIELLPHDVQPAKPTVFVGAGPERSVLLPEAGDFVAASPVIERRGNAGGEVLGELVGQAV